MKTIERQLPVLWSVVLWLGHLLCVTNSSTDGLFACRNLSSAHYNFLKPPGDSVSLACPKNCSSGETQWYHSYVKTTAAAGRGLDLLAWSGSSHEAAVRETPSQGSVGFFCCVCEGEEDAVRDGCCWGVAYQPVVNVTLTASQSWRSEEEMVAVSGRNLSLRCEARGFPNISIAISPPANSSLSVPRHCREVERSWYSSVVVCNWTAGGEAERKSFRCNGTILMDSVKNQIVPYTRTASQQLSICNAPSLVRLYQASKLEAGSRLDLKCEVDCCRASVCSVSWYFEAVEIDHGDTNYEISSEEELVHVLSVVNPGRGSLGRYFCVLRSPLRETPDKRTLTVTLPGRVSPTPMRPLPGPVREEDTEARVTGVLLGFMWVTITGAAVAAIALAFIMRRARQPATRGVVEGSVSGNTDGARLIRATSEPDDVEKDGIRHRLSENTLIDSDLSD